MDTLVDIFGYLTVVLNGINLVAMTMAFGSVLFLTCLALPLAAQLKLSADAVAEAGARYARWGGIATAIATLSSLTLNALVLSGTLEMPVLQVAGAFFIEAGIVQVLAAIAIVVVARGHMTRPRVAVLTALALLMLVASLATSHAAARPGERVWMLLATFSHILGAGLWLGGLPAFLSSLGQAQSRDEGAAIGQRYSLMSITGVILIVLGAIGISIGFIGGLQGFYGTAYGAMAATKGVMLGILLLLGLGNFRTIRRFAAGQGESLTRVRRFVEIEIAFAIAILLAAGSITSQPPASDLTDDRATWAEVVERMTPIIPPRLESPSHDSLAIPALQEKLDQEWRNQQASNRPQAFVPGAGELPPRNADDIAWSEYNHHWAGLVVLLVGLFALLERAGVRWAKHWPLLFLILAGFLFLRSDPETWPMGNVGFWDSFRDPEVVQHRIFVVLIIAFTVFEWGVRTGRWKNQALALVFPVLTTVGGDLLLTHNHAISNIKEQLLIELSHLFLAVLGVAAGAARWMQIRGSGRDARWAGWIWPTCFVLVGLLLLAYREA
ncbi:MULTISPECIES: CopD family protein [Nitrospirillum]|uniref:Putative copper resistance protein D n=1 Tax=Nitrospirillum amazonense TaxID=28077 RepID=A0A560G457_9PROT|nr:copper resistance protein [Nitrospirillum amazonense]MEC4593325.1 copper resistance protein [Nitrospirillum amazonense]TWB28530.1 putative copper resistance protein D [Nitrospirillum amazonense]